MEKILLVTALLFADMKKFFKENYQGILACIMILLFAVGTILLSHDFNSYSYQIFMNDKIYNSTDVSFQSRDYIKFVDLATGDTVYLKGDYKIVKTLKP